MTPDNLGSRFAVTAVIAVAGLALFGCVAATPPTASPTTPAGTSGIPSVTGSPASVAPPVRAGAAVRYRCEPTSPPFGLDLLSSPPLAEFDLDPSAGALRGYLSRGELPPSVPRAGWWLTGRTGQQAWFMAPHGETDRADRPPFVQIVAAPRAAGWEVLYWEECRPSLLVANGQVGSWTFDPSEPAPGPASTRFVALVHERACASGRAPDGRVLPPTIVYRERDILVLFAVTPLPGGQDCPGAPPARVVVQLREPIGNRQLLDAGTYPFRDPRVPF